MKKPGKLLFSASSNSFPNLSPDSGQFFWLFSEQSWTNCNIYYFCYDDVRMRRDFQNVTMSTIYDWICVIWRELAKKHTHNARLQVHINSPGHVLPSAGFAEERVVRFVAIVHHVWLVTDQVTIWVNSMLQTVKFPACIAHLYPSLAHVNRYAFPLEKKPKFIRGKNKQLLVHVMPFISKWQTQTQCVRYITCGSSLS